jgi:hypothetical protein
MMVENYHGIWKECVILSHFFIVLAYIHKPTYNNCKEIFFCENTEIGMYLLNFAPTKEDIRHLIAICCRS